jgi:lysozyme
MQMTEEGLALIRRFEGFRGEAYRCPAGVWTIGYGHTSQAGPPRVTPGMRMSEAEAEAVLARDVQEFARAVTAALRRDVSPQQFSALVSFAYNVGAGAFTRSSVLKAVNEGDMEAVPARLRLWVKADGRTLQGLVRRREAEAALFQSAPLVRVTFLGWLLRWLLSFLEKKQ